MGVERFLKSDAFLINNNVFMWILYMFYSMRTILGMIAYIAWVSNNEYGMPTQSWVIIDFVMISLFVVILMLYMCFRRRYEAHNVALALDDQTPLMAPGKPVQAVHTETSKLHTYIYVYI